MGKCPLPQVGNLPSLVASIFSASLGSSWRNRLVIRVFIFRLFPTSGKQNVETGGIQGCWKRLLRNRLGNSAFRPLSPRSQKKTKVGRGLPSPRGPRDLRGLSQPPVLRFSKPETSLALALLGGFSQKQKQPLSIFLPRADSQKPPPQPPTELCGELPPTTVPANLKPDSGLPGL